MNERQTDMEPIDRDVLLKCRRSVWTTGAWRTTRGSVQAQPVRV